MDEGRRRFGLLAAAEGLMPMPAIPADVCPEGYPKRPITLIVGQPLGDGADLIARHVASLMEETLGQKIIIENRPGAAGNVAAASVARMNCDGYVLFLAARPVILHKRMYRDIKYDFFRDFAPVGMVARVPYVLIMGKHVVARTLQDVIALANEYPEMLTCGSGGVGSTTHLLCETLRERARLPWTHIPYNGDTPALVDVIAGRLDFSIVTAPSVLTHIDSGNIRAITVFSRKRVFMMSSVPSLSEYGFMDADAEGWFALMAPTGTPSHAIARLNQAINGALVKPAIRTRLARAGFVMPFSNNTSDDLETFLKDDAEKWIATIDARQIGGIQ
ncbi:tripartite tricarboxylate transporter substrate binding protein [Sphingobium sp.]|uniref:Bug family tripartite tricarboxylate transporter substrate binding protein n=1 Tax=Sphingobium sp. TaxID=1912891 RepID=UPI0028BE2707|nr:tripartite tricarboxylate transporter substrate binding protein [Sphingobium sp.]